MSTAPFMGGDKVVSTSALLMIAVLTTVILKTLSFLFLPLAMAILILYALGIPLDYLKRFHLPASVRILLVLLLLFLCFYGVGNLVKLNISQFQAKLPEYETKFFDYSGLILQQFGISVQEFQEMMRGFLQNIDKANIKPVGTLVRYLGEFFLSLLGNLLWILLFIAFLLAERETFQKRISRAYGKENADNIHKTLATINSAVQQYLGLKTLVSLLTGVVVFFITLAFGVHFAVLWGVLTFVLNFIPNIGSLLATLPPVAITLFQHGSISRALMVAVAITAVQLVVGNFIEPKIMGRGLNLSPLVVLLSLLFWGWLWGITGMLLSVPLTAAVKIAMEQIDSTRPFAVMMSGR